MGSDKYVLGFNQAYVLMGKKPDVLDFLFNVKSESEYILGLKDGRSQFYYEFIEYDLKKTPKLNVVEKGLGEIKKP
jgi:hypothetical protein